MALRKLGDKVSSKKTKKHSCKTWGLLLSGLITLVWSIIVDKLFLVSESHPASVPSYSVIGMKKATVGKKRPNIALTTHALSFITNLLENYHYQECQKCFTCFYTYPPLREVRYPERPTLDDVLSARNVTDRFVTFATARWIRHVVVVVDSANSAIISATDHTDRLAISAARTALDCIGTKRQVARGQFGVAFSPRCQLDGRNGTHPIGRVTSVEFGAIVQFAVRTLRRNNGSELTVRQLRAWCEMAPRFGTCQNGKLPQLQMETGDAFWNGNVAIMTNVTGPTVLKTENKTNLYLQRLHFILVNSLPMRKAVIRNLFRGGVFFPPLSFIFVLLSFPFWLSFPRLEVGP